MENVGSGSRRSGSRRRAVVIRAVVVGQSSSGSRRRADVVVRHLFDPLSQCIFAGETLDLKDKDS